MIIAKIWGSDKMTELQTENCRFINNLHPNVSTNGFTLYWVNFIDFGSLFHGFNSRLNNGAMQISKALGTKLTNTVFSNMKQYTKSNGFITATAQSITELNNFTFINCSTISGAIIITKYNS